MARMKTLLSVCLASAACGGGARNAVTVSGRLSASGGQALPTADAGAQIAEGITLTRARVAVRRLRVENKTGDVQVNLSEGPLLLDASGDGLAGALLQLVTANVPAGSYDKLKLDVHRVEEPAPAAFADLVKQGASVLLEGTVDGQSFTFASALEAELEHEGNFTIGGGTANITLDLDASKWFQAADGSRLDPRDPAAKLQIDSNIRASFRAFEDDDEDGVEDVNDDHGHDGADAGDDRGGHDGGDDHGGEDGGSGHH